jgi:hypothetical protein
MSTERQQNHSDRSIEVNHIVPVTEEARHAAFIMLFWLDACRNEYQAAYELHQGDIGGFLMMELAARAGCIFTREAGSLVADDDYRWFEAIGGFASDVVRHLTRTLIDRTEMHRLAAENIAKNEYVASR